MRLSAFRLALCGASFLAVVPAAPAVGQTCEFETINYPGSAQTFAGGINQKGDVVGLYAVNISGALVGHGFLLSEGKYTAIDVPGADSTAASAINNAGQIVGSYIIGNYSKGFLLTSSGFQTIEVPGWHDVGATGINDLGEIVGSVSNGNVGHGFIIRSGVMSPVIFPGASQTILSGINNEGSIVGGYLYPGPLDFHGFRLKGGTSRPWITQRLHLRVCKPLTMKGSYWESLMHLFCPSCGKTESLTVST
jgi:uncharacterized membrane protein